MANIHVRSKYLSDLKIGRLEASYSTDGSRILRYSIDFRHKELDLHKTLSAPELLVLQNKVDALISSWDKKYDDFIHRTQLFSEKSKADQATTDAAEALVRVRNILTTGIGHCSAIDWEQLKDTSKFPKDFNPSPAPQRPPPTETPSYEAPQITFWDKLFGRATRLASTAQSEYQTKLQAWNAAERQRDQIFRQQKVDWERRTQLERGAFERELEIFLTEQRANNAKVDELALAITQGAEEAILEQVTLVLDRSDYGELFEKSYDLEYLAKERTLLIQYQLPSPDEMPRTKSVRFIKATGELKETFIGEREKQANFDSACFQICLRTLYEIFDADLSRNIFKIAFNGTTRFIDKATGRDVDACIMSIVVDRDTFQSIDLTRIDPKTCFKSLKGVSASTLSALAPVAPLIKLNKEDKRFIEARDTISDVNTATNLAAMDWEDFEHLVRGLFEREFASRGGEVKITQSSSDGGVDAVAFDPDPITGGKIVIQAKRYTKTVGVSAVRDLYGTMQHESASRGILVTTADFGPDAHRFSAGKPITLLTGANLLHLLEKHGFNAKIDLREARKILNLREYR